MDAGSTLLIKFDAAEFSEVKGVCHVWTDPANIAVHTLPFWLCREDTDSSKHLKVELMPALDKS
jgi:hypothetical protein